MHWEKSEHLCQFQKKTQQEIRKLQEALTDATSTDGVSLDKELHDDFTQLINDYSKNVRSAKTYLTLFGSNNRLLIH